MDLLNNKISTLKLPNAELVHIENFYSVDKANLHFEYLKVNCPWHQDNIALFGKTYPQPRLTALFGNNGLPYTYSNIKMIPHKFTDQLKESKKDVELQANHEFTTVLVNFYRDGNDSNGWHADNEKELGTNPVIASLSFDESRWFSF